MNLIHRPVLLSDVEEAIDGIRDGFLYTDPVDRRDLVRFWQEMIAEGGGHLVLVEDRDAPVGRRFHYSGVCVFLTDEFLASAKRGEAAYISRHVLALWRAGRSPLLDAAQVRRANSTTGVSMLAMNTGLLPEDLDPEAGRQMRDHGDSYAYHGLGGFNMRELLCEAYGDFQRQWFLGLGMRPRSDNTAYFAARGLAVPSPDRYPWLIGITPGELASQHGAGIRHGFVTGKPRFFFKPAEQRMLLFAMEGLTDEEVAEYLGVSVATVRKHWGSVYA